MTKRYVTDYDLDVAANCFKNNIVKLSGIMTKTTETKS